MNEEEFETIFNKEWLDANQEVIASWSVFYLIWSIMHSFAAVRLTTLYANAYKLGVTGSEEETILISLEAKGKEINKAYEFMYERYSKFNFAGLAHKPVSEQEEAYLAALDAVKEVQKSLRLNVYEIDKLEKEVLQGEFGFVDKLQYDFLRISFGGNKNLIKILDVLDAWTLAKGIS